METLMEAHSIMVAGLAPRLAAAKLPLPCPCVHTELTTVVPMQIIIQAFICNDMYAGPAPRLAASMQAAAPGISSTPSSCLL